MNTEYERLQQKLIAESQGHQATKQQAAAELARSEHETQQTAKSLATTERQLASEREQLRGLQSDMKEWSELKAKDDQKTQQLVDKVLHQKSVISNMRLELATKSPPQRSPAVTPQQPMLTIGYLSAAAVVVLFLLRASLF